MDHQLRIRGKYTVDSQLLHSRDFRLLSQDEFGNLELIRPATRRLRYQTISPIDRVSTSRGT